MFPAPNSDLSPLVRKLESIVALTAEEREAVLRIPVTVRALKADQDIVRDQDRPSQCCLILDGFAFRYKVLAGGKRQILSFHIRVTFRTCRASISRSWTIASER